MNSRAKKTKEQWPKIRKRGESWLVDCAFVFGKRRRKSFTELAEAEKYAEDMRAERREMAIIQKNERRNRHVTLANLTDTQRAEIVQAYDLLGTNRGLLDAVRFFVDHSGPDNGGATLETVFDAYMESKRKKNMRERSVKNVEARLRSFVYENRDRPAHSVTTADIEAHIDMRGGTWATRETYRVAFNGLFGWAVKRRYIKSNPAAIIERGERDEAKPGVHTAAQVKAILTTAEQLHPEMIPYFAIGYFAGLRPENELTGLDWSNIDLKERLIYVDPATAKKRRERYVKVSDNLAAWLTGFPQSGGKVFFSRRYYRAIREVAKVKWSHDVMRHSYGTYHLAHHENKELTAKEMGHSDIDVLMRHYQRPVKPKDASAYWKIKPIHGGKIIKLRKTA